MDKWQKKDIVWDRLICIYVENLYEGEKNECQTTNWLDIKPHKCKHIVMISLDTYLFLEPD